MEVGNANKLCPGDGRIRVETNGSGRAILSDLAFSYPLKLMPPRIAASDARLSPGLLPLYILTYGKAIPWMPMSALHLLKLRTKAEVSCLAMQWISRL